LIKATGDYNLWVVLRIEEQIIFSEIKEASLLKITRDNLSLNVISALATVLQFVIVVESSMNPAQRSGWITITSVRYVTKSDFFSNRSPCLAPNDNNHRIFSLCIVCHIVVQSARPTSDGLRAGGDMHGCYAGSHLHEILPNEEC
jgi:hypothetical protein